MYFENWHELLAMKGHGPFVWSAYAITLVVLVSLVYGPLARRRRALERVARQQRVNPAEAKS